MPKAGPVTDEARELFVALNRELHLDSGGPCPARAGDVRIESTYSVVRAISGTPLRDSFHLGSTIVNDYGRPYENGLNNYSGLSAYATAGRFPPLRARRVSGCALGYRIFCSIGSDTVVPGRSDQLCHKYDSACHCLSVLFADHDSSRTSRHRDPGTLP